MPALKMPPKKSSPKSARKTPGRKRSISVPKKKAAVPKKSAAKKPSALVRRRRVLLKAVRRRAANFVPEPPKPHRLERHDGNPIIGPREGNYWEMKATFNPGAVYADHRVHLLYRAIGGDDVSVLGYAASDDGLTFDDRSHAPAFGPRSGQLKEERQEASANEMVSERKGPPIEARYFSGGGWNGGVEDPRLTLLGDRVYLTYTAFDGWGSIRMAMSSIALEDFLNRRWKWRRPALISPPGEIHKNWVLFPEKINGKFAILHGITPSVLIEYRDSLDFAEDDFIRSPRPSNDRVKIREGVWDSWIRGVGPPPIKTDLGWLLFYHAMDLKDPNRYKLGAMILDLDDPSKVLYRTRSPILEPDFDYENNGFKSGVVYSCGAVVKDGELFVYYGGADSVTCVAMADLDTFLRQLTTYGVPRLDQEPTTTRPPRNARR